MFDSKRHLSADFYRETFETAFQADNREQHEKEKRSLYFDRRYTNAETALK